MDRERCLVHREVAVVDRAVVAHEQQVADPDVPEVHTERDDSEMLGQLGVAGGDVSGDAFVEAVRWLSMFLDTAAAST